MTESRLPRTATGTHSGAFTPLDWGLLAGCAVIWGSSFYFMAIGLRSLEPGVITFLRIALGAAALAVLPAARTHVARADWPRVVLLGATWMAIPFTMFPLAEQRISSSLTGMLNAAMPVLTAIVALAMTRQRPRLAQAGGLAVGLVGTLAISWKGLDDGGASAVGVLMVLVAVAGYAVSVNIAIPLQQRYGSLAILVRIQAVAMVMTAPYALIGLPDSSWEREPVLSILALGALGTGLAFAMMGVLMVRVGATRSSVATYLMPVVSIVLGATLLDESIHVAALVGTVLVLLGAWLVSRAESVVVAGSADQEAGERPDRGDGPDAGVEQGSTEGRTLEVAVPPVLGWADERHEVADHQGGTQGQEDPLEQVVTEEHGPAR